jgi:hypothetical protein
MANSLIVRAGRILVAELDFYQPVTMFVFVEDVVVQGKVSLLRAVVFGVVFLVEAAVGAELVVRADRRACRAIAGQVVVVTFVRSSIPSN